MIVLTAADAFRRGGQACAKGEHRNPFTPFVTGGKQAQAKYRTLSVAWGRGWEAAYLRSLSSIDQLPVGQALKMAFPTAVGRVSCGGRAVILTGPMSAFKVPLP